MSCVYRYGQNGQFELLIADGVFAFAESTIKFYVNCRGQKTKFGNRPESGNPVSLIRYYVQFFRQFLTWIGII